MQSGIYKITNITNNKYYIGSSLHIKTRWNMHRWQLQHNIHTNRHLQNAWNKYGSDAFIFEIIKYVSSNKLLVEEQKILNNIVGNRQCYNIGSDAIAPMRGRTLTYSHKNALRNSNIGRIKSKQEIDAIRNSLSGRKIIWADKIRKTIERQGMKKISDTDLAIARGIYSLYPIKSSSLAKYFNISENYMIHLLTDSTRRKNVLPDINFDRQILFGLDFINAKLQPKQIVKIRNLYNNGTTQKKLAQQYNVSVSLISQIVNNLIWNDPWLYKK